MHQIVRKLRPDVARRTDNCSRYSEIWFAILKYQMIYC